MKKTITTLLLSLICFTKTFSQSSKPCVKYPDIIDDFSIFKPNYHQYQVDYEICDLEKYPQCTPELVFKTMLSSTAYIAPFANDNPVKSCEKVQVPGFGTIVTVINQKTLSVTNYTTPEHRLHAGKVTRQVVKQGNKIIVFTFGNGNNRNAFYAWINEIQTSADLLWHSVDKELKNAVEEVLQKQPQNTDPTPNLPQDNLSDGARLLFSKGIATYYSKLQLTSSEKEEIYNQLNLQISLDKKQLHDKKDNKFEYRLSCTVEIIDLNNDGKLEVFVSLYNLMWTGQGGYQIGFGKNSSGKFSEILNEQGGAAILTTTANGYPDLLIGGPGMTAPTYRWNGTKYQFYKEVNFGAGSAPKMISFADYYKKQKPK